MRLGAVPTECAEISSPPAESDRVWFTDHVLPHGTLLRNFLRRQFPTISDAEDVVQESFLRVWKARPCGSPAAIRGFLFTTAKRIALDILRRRRCGPFVPVEPREMEWIVDERCSTPDLVNHREEVALLAEAVSKLPLRSQTVLRYARLEGASVRETAARLGIGESTAERHVRSGVRWCAEYLRAYGVCR